MNEGTNCIDLFDLLLVHQRQILWNVVHCKGHYRELDCRLKHHVSILILEFELENSYRSVRFGHCKSALDLLFHHEFISHELLHHWQCLEINYLWKEVGFGEIFEARN